MVNSITDLPGVARAADDARADVDRLLSHRILRRQSADVSAESALRGARATAALEGADLPLAQIRAGAEGSAKAQGAIRVSAELGTFVETWRRAPLQVLARLHVLAATGVVGAEERGRPRSDQHLDDPLLLGDPPSPEQVSVRLDALARLVVEESAMPAVVLAGITHGELLALRPFAYGSGVIARAAERLVLISRGLDSKSLTTPETGHWELSDDYADAARGYAGGSSSGVAGWLRHCAAAVSLGAREATAICESLSRSPGS